METTAHFHFRIKNFGPSALSDRVDYITRMGASRDREDLVTVESGNLPAWATSARMFWDAVERRETGNAADSFILAVPRNLSPEAVARLRERFGQTLAQGRPYTLAEHCDVARDYEENRHFHALVSPRMLDSVNRPEAQFFARYRPKHPRSGGARKNTRKGPKKEREKIVFGIRSQWASELNRELEAAGLPLVDPRSLSDQGIGRKPIRRQNPEALVRAREVQGRARGAAFKLRTAAKQAAARADAMVMIRETPLQARTRWDNRDEFAHMLDKVRRKKAVELARQTKEQVAQSTRGDDAVVLQARERAQALFDARLRRPEELERLIRHYGCASPGATTLRINMPQRLSAVIPAVLMDSVHVPDPRIYNHVVVGHVAIERLARNLSRTSRTTIEETLKIIVHHGLEPVRDRRAVKNAQQGRDVVSRAQDEIEREAATGKARGWDMDF